MLRAIMAFIVGGAAMLATAGAANEPAVQDLGAEFWAWRATTQPATSDDIPRIERPDRWVPDWSPAAVERQKEALRQFEARWQRLADEPRNVSQSVDYRLVGSALARVRWELDHVAAWRRQPHFYVAQAFTPVFETLLPPPPVESARIEQVVRLLDNAPSVFAAGQQNLDDMRGPFVDAALSQLDHVPASLRGMVAGLDPHATPAQRSALAASAERAIASAEQFARFLENNRAGLPDSTAVGADSYRFFLNEVALYPYSPADLLVMGRQEWARSVLFEELERNRNADVPELPIGRSIDAVTAQLDADELEVRKFLRERGLLTVPDWAGHYNAQPFPDYLAPIGWLGRTFDLTSQSRVGQDATVYLPDPSPDLGYFNLSITRDPKPIIVHEGVPGHFFQLTLGWKHPNPLRRHYYDSGANEGTGFYAEEMMLQAGLWSDAPKSREIIYNFARARALRVEVDVKLAMGEFTIAEAADYLEAMVPIHVFLWLNGNVPIALQKEEYFATTGED